MMLRNRASHAKLKLFIVISVLVILILILALFSFCLTLNWEKVKVAVVFHSLIPSRQRKRTPPSSTFRPVYDVCIAGAGLSGAVLAERYASQRNQTVLILEKRGHIGGNCYDYIDDETGIRVSKYGAHLFHTKSERVWSYVTQFSQWEHYEHRVLGFVDEKYVPIPVNIDTVNALFGTNISSSLEMDAWLKEEQVQYEQDPQNSEEMALSRVGERLYLKIFKPYTIKQWGKLPSELAPEVTARIPVRNDHDSRYFTDPYQFLPKHGYTAFFERLLHHPNIDLHVNIDYMDVKSSLNCTKTYFTGPIDSYFYHLGWPKLEYRSLQFQRKVITNVDLLQPSAVVNHPSLQKPYTRIVEYKHFLKQNSPHTVIFLETSSDKGEPYYPVPNEPNKALYARYQEYAARMSDITFVGRLANYKYFNMDEAILNALSTFDEDTHSSENTPSDTCVGTGKALLASSRY